MQRRSFLQMAGGACVAPLLPAAAARRPNIVVIVADDLGFGDIGCYGATRVKTPNLDRLAASGLRFTDAHSSSATCTPSRYSMMTGEYAFRKKGTGVLPGDAALVVDPNRATLPSILQQAGYTTGAFGKWHLGLGSGNVDWNSEIKPGPLDIGFNEAFIMPATGDRVPCVYVENRRVYNLDPKDPIKVSYEGPVGDWPTGRDHPELLRVKYSHGHDQTIVNGISRIGYMTGGKTALWKDEDMAKTFTGRATSFIEKNKAKPFFMYFATHDIHVPRVPHDRFRGGSELGVRGDVIQQLDSCVGEIMATLKRNNLEKDTLLIFTSDNGPVVDDGYADGAVENLKDHKPAGALRGGKYSIYEGGTRMPFIARWTGHIKPGTSDALVGSMDFLASFAALAGRDVPADAAPDSFNVLPALLGQSKKGREHLLEHSGMVAIRKGPWKLIPARPQPPNAKRQVGGPVELYNLSQDIGETKNVAAENPEIVRELSAMLEKQRTSGRTRP